MSHQPLCFILMPFGVKPVSHGRKINFDLVYHQIIVPAVRAAGMEPLRADEEKHGGIIHKAMYERLLLCDYAIADLTTANANVFYELGVRHAVRPAATTLIFAQGYGSLPFDVNGLRGLPYKLGIDCKPARTGQDVAALTARLRHCRDAANDAPTDSPLYQLLQGFPDITHLKTDVFHQQARYCEQLKQRLNHAKAMKNQAEAVAAIDDVRDQLDNFAEAEPGVLIDLMLSYRAQSQWSRITALIEAMPSLLSDTVLVQEQYALALNRDHRDEEAELVLTTLMSEHGPSSETCGLLGRVYKDRWKHAKANNKLLLAKGFLAKAIDAYLSGFEADWRDAYPGINTLMLMEHCEPPDPRRIDLNTVVRYAVERRIAGGHPDHRDHSTLLELAVLAHDGSAAATALGNALATLQESWQAESTNNNIRLLRDVRQQRGENVDLENEVIAELDDIIL